MGELHTVLVKVLTRVEVEVTVTIDKPEASA
jgi:hypothetical protein